MDEFTFTMNVRVHDAPSLHRAAYKHATEIDGFDDDETLELIGTEEEPNVEGCLVMILDPGHMPGCDIGASYAERF